MKTKQRKTGRKHKKDFREGERGGGREDKKKENSKRGQNSEVVKEQN